MECSHYMKNYDVGHVPLRLPRAKQVAFRSVNFFFTFARLPVSSSPFGGRFQSSIDCDAYILTDHR